jgi:galactokinase
MSNLQTKSGELEQELFARARHVVSEIERVKNAESALVRDDFKAFGELLDQSHNSLRDDYGVSCPELDCAVEVARTEGALGARMVGGGFGGSAIALVRDGETGRIASAIERSFAKNNFRTPRFFDAVASEGARLVNGSN